jgi:Sulfotransferase family
VLFDHRRRPVREGKRGDKRFDSLPAIFQFTGDWRKEVHSRLATSEWRPTRAPILLFDRGMQNNAAMRWTWPFKPRVNDDRKGGDNHYLAGDPSPDFLCVGAQKGGTSWLYRQLERHPDFWMPPVKELHYFNSLNRTKRFHSPRCRDRRDVSFLDGMKNLSALSYIDLENYGRLFEHKGSLVSGDISPAYSTVSDEIIQRVVNSFPNLKVIFLARDPVERAWSQLSMGIRLGMISPFDATDADEVIRNLLNPGVLLRSHPSKIVARWRRYVRPDLFHMYFFDDLERNPVELRRSILVFLGADPNKSSGRLRADDNQDAKRDKLRLTNKVRSRVAKFFEEELKACAAELGGPAQQWPTRYGFSLLILVVQLLDDFDILFWCDWIA